MKQKSIDWFFVKILNWLENRFEDFIEDFKKHGGI